MKFNLKKLLFFAPLMTLMFCFNSPQNDEEKMQTIMISVKNTLSYLHYSPKPINDAYSADVFDKYLEMMDPAKKFLLQSDVDEFTKHKTKLDDYLNRGDISFFNLTVDRLSARTKEVEKLSQDILSKPINFDENEELILEPKLKTYPKNQEELRNEWKKFIKYNILQEIETLNAKEQTQKEKKDSVNKFKLKDTIKLQILTPQQKQAKATDEVKDLLTSMFKRYDKRKKMDWFSVYMNAYTEVFDPHTNYFSPQDKEDFDVNFKGKVIGIGIKNLRICIHINRKQIHFFSFIISLKHRS
jgi:carboxyl-terminal processing protease